MQALRGDNAFAGSPDHAPTEAKMLAIFIALQERYKDKLFGVGFRSGTIDGAGFLGIPILYFDDTTSKTEEEFARYADGQYLVSLAKDKGPADAKEPETYERILELTRAINTFIRINNFPHKNASKKIVLDAVARKHFVLALRLWIFTRQPAAGAAVGEPPPLWRKRIGLLHTRDARTLEYLQGLFATYHAS